MPAFFVLFLYALPIRVAFLDGAADGYAYLFKPDWSAMADPQTWVYAMGQAFFSLSIAGSGTVVYGSYLKSDVDIVSSAKYVAFFDTLAALLAGLVIIPCRVRLRHGAQFRPGASLHHDSRRNPRASHSDRRLPSCSSLPYSLPGPLPLSICWKARSRPCSPGSDGPDAPALILDRSSSPQPPGSSWRATS